MRAPSDRLRSSGLLFIATLLLLSHRPGGCADWVPLKHKREDHNENIRQHAAMIQKTWGQAKSQMSREEFIESHAANPNLEGFFILHKTATGGILIGTFGVDEQLATADDLFYYLPLE